MSSVTSGLIKTSFTSAITMRGELLNFVIKGTSQTSCSDERAGQSYNDDVAIISAVRTPICKAFRGQFKDTSARDLLSAVLKAVVERSTVNPGEVGDIAVGMVLGPAGKRTKDCRMAMLEAGFPEKVPIHSVNRQCGSGLQAIADIAACVKAGFIDIGIAAGVESMTSDYSPGWKGSINPKVYSNQKAKDCLLPMGLMSENVASAYKISRKEQDASAVLSHERAYSALSNGRFEAEIIPVKTKFIDARSGQEEEITVLTDDGIRSNTNMSALSSLKPVFKMDGSTTAERMALFLRGRAPEIQGLHMPIDESTDLVEQEYVDDTMIFCQYDSDTLDRI
ncbi:hypothetical protein L7F22_038552 [Adiantum nelumboides]|nr:hypothetical protein [Adiantum nelumboides]